MKMDYHTHHCLRHMELDLVDLDKIAVEMVVAEQNQRVPHTLEWVLHHIGSHIALDSIVHSSYLDSTHNSLLLDWIVDRHTSCLYSVEGLNWTLDSYQIVEDRMNPRIAGGDNSVADHTVAAVVVAVFVEDD